MGQEKKYDTQYASRVCYPCEVLVDKKIHTFAIVASYNLWQNALATDQYEPNDYAEYYERQKDFTQLMLVGEREMLLLILPRPLDKLDCPLSVSMPEGQGEKRIKGRAEFLGVEQPVELISAHFVDSWDSFKDEVGAAIHRRWLERRTQAVPQCCITSGAEPDKKTMRENTQTVIEVLRKEGILPHRDKAKRGKNRSYSPSKRGKLYDAWQRFKDVGGTRLKNFIEENANFCREQEIANAEQLKLAIESERKKRKNKKKS